MKIRVYVEGGGDRSDLKGICREGFSKFFEKILGGKPKPKIIACGPRNSAFEQFKLALKHHRGEFIVLLVDSEGPVTADTPWAHLQERDRWIRPEGATDESVHLMVQCMESWFLVDRESLEKFFGQGFQASALPKNPNIEAISKEEVLRALKAATRQTKSKGEYSKGRNSFELLGEIDPAKVRRGSPHVERLARALLNPPNP